MQFKNNGRSHQSKNPTDLIAKYVISLCFKGILNTFKRKSTNWKITFAKKNMPNTRLMAILSKDLRRLELNRSQFPSNQKTIHKREHTNHMKDFQLKNNSN